MIFQNSFAVDFNSQGSDYAVPEGKLVPVYVSKDLKSEKIGFMPEGSYIKLLHKDDPRSWKTIRFAYIAARPECSKASQVKEINERVLQMFNVSLGMNQNDADVSVNVRTVLRDNEIPEYCFKISQGFVQEEQLTEPGQVKTQASVKSQTQCTDCKSANILSEAAKNITSMMEKGDSDVPRPSSKLCSSDGKPKIIKLGTITLKAHWQKRIVEEDKVAINSKGVRYKEKVLKNKWFCEIDFASGCEDKEATLPKVVSIADYFVENKQPQLCTQTLEKFYNQCGVWKDKSFQTRFSEVKAASQKVVTELKKQEGKEFTSSITPELLQCIAVRENRTLEPSRVNYRACDNRIDPKRKYRKELLEYLGDFEMLKWRSAAYGLNQSRFETFKENWDKFLKFKKPLFYNDKNKTYAEIFESAEELFEVMADLPELQIEKMARDLSFRYLKFNLDRYTSKGHSRFDATILSYDGDQAKTYLPAIKGCMQCLKKSPGNEDCFENIHGPQIPNKRKVTNI
ncbi:MAG: hypothetical protein IPM57_10870 [Oligoflexia bacterium]|nr:hypothetical protein [Oligoflexia bacterium]